MYTLIFSESALKFLRKLDRPIARRIVSTLERQAGNPQFKPKRLVNSPYSRYRIGDYRVILRIKQDQLVIYVITVNRRDKIYKHKK